MRPSDSVDIAEIVEPMSEADFQAQVVKFARLTGWLCYHTYDSRRSEPGFPDLVLTNAERDTTLFAELKADGGKVTAAQRKWLRALRATGQIACVWRPHMLDEIVAWLGHPHIVAMPPGHKD